MGAGNKLDATAFRVADISETSVCPLAKVMRRELKKRGLVGVKVGYSEGEPLKPAPSAEAGKSGRRVAGRGALLSPPGGGVFLGGGVQKFFKRGKRP